MYSDYSLISINENLVINKQILCEKFNGTKSKSDFLCLVCGNKFHEILSFVSRNDYSCRVCNKHKRELDGFKKANAELVSHGLVCIKYAGTVDRVSEILCLNCGNIISKPISDFKESNYACHFCYKIKSREKTLIKNYDNIYSIIKEKEDGYKYHVTDNDYIDFVCPECKSTSKKKISNVYKNGFKCTYCSDNVSFPNKIMRSVLDELKIDYIPEANFYWGINKSTNKRYRYDFYIKDKSCIVEMMGMQHEQDVPNWKVSAEEIKTRDADKKELAIRNGISNYIEIDCCVSDIDYIFNNLLKSKLANIIDLDSVDKNRVGEISAKSIMIECWNIWNSNPDCTTTELCKIFKLERHAIIDYLKAGSKIGCCNYDTTIENKKRVKRGIRTRCGVLNLYDDSGKVIRSFDSVLDICRKTGCESYPIYKELRKNGFCYFDGKLLRREV